MAKVRIYGAKTLDRYTQHILAEGFRNNQWVVETDGEVRSSIDAVIYQLHGAPQSEKDDDKIIKSLKSAVSKVDKMKTVVVLHRPDELQRYSELKEILSNPAKKIGLVFFGDKHIDDDFFPSYNVIKRIIPHGFFPLKDYIQLNPVVIGSHTTWGEMRSIEHALKLLFEIFKMYKGDRKVIGYLGGKPPDQLQKAYLEQAWKNIGESTAINFLDIREYTLDKAIQKYPNQNIILANPVDLQPSEFGMTFNIQMYYLGNKVRTGESSGTLHASTGIPIILEMNGAEKIENLKVIKIPYGNIKDIKSINFVLGAKEIIEAINSNSYVEMLKHNLKQSLFWNNTRIASEYVKLFNEL